jgi:glycosyltransferase involved in cell wall biosynthesis
MSRPEVTIVTPTYNRRRFLPALIECYKAQTFPLTRMEWIILDDGEDCVRDVFEAAAKTIPNVRYIRHERKQVAEDGKVSLLPKLLIGAKRNWLNREARGEIIVAMDDDDYYPPERVRHVVTKFTQHPKVELAGSSEIYVYYTDVKEIYKLGPYKENHATNGTMAWRRSYARSHKYDETVTHAEERSFLDDYTHPMIQLDPFKVMLVISHSENTFDKKQLRDQAGNSNPFIKQKHHTKMDAFIKDAKLRKFFKDA